MDPKTGKKEKVAKLDTPMGLGSVWLTQAGVVVAHSRNKEIGRFQAAHGVPWQEPWSRSKSYWPCVWSLSFIDETHTVVSHTFPIISFWNIDTHERLNASIAQNGRIIAHAGPQRLRFG